MLLSVAHSDYRSLGKWFTTIKTMSLLSAASRTLIELIDWLSAVLGRARSARDATSATLRKLGDGWSISGVCHSAVRTPFQYPGQRGRYAVWSRNLYTTGSLAPGATLADAGRRGSVSSRVNEFFNTKAFVPAPFVPDGGLIDGKYPVSGGGTMFGNLGRNILRGPDQQDFDIAAIKTTPLTERVKLIFRWEIFNVLNRPNFANPSNDVSTPSTFGVISALTVNPRIMQYALKLEF